MSEAKQAASASETIADVDVAVIGGGVAGCYTAWRLRTLDKHQLASTSPLLPLFEHKERLDVALFESSDRIGGRLWSAALKGMPDEYAEFGGMRFYKQMQIVWDLVERLGLGPQAIPFPVGAPDNFVYVRGQHMRVHELSNQPHDLPYQLRYLERGKTSDQLIDFVSEMAVAGYGELRKQYWTAFDAEDWDKVSEIRGEYERRKRATKIDGRTVYDVSWWELQTHLLSHEAFEFILATGGYDVTNTNGNAAHSMDQNFFAPESAGFFRLSGGFEGLPDSLQAEFHEHGGATFMLHRLLTLNKADASGDGGPYDLLFHQRDNAEDLVDGLSAAALERRGQVSVKARAKMVVLALPVRALRLLDQDNFFFMPGPRDGVDRKEKLDAAMNSVLHVEAFKLFLAYRQPWWEQTGVDKGQSVTDLPIRQCYYWANDVGKSTVSPSGTNSILMATYNNGAAVSYWQSLQSGEPFGPDPAAAEDGDAFQGRAFGYVNRVMLRLDGEDQAAAESTTPTQQIPRTATKAMVARAHAQLMELHDVKYAPEPYDAHFQDWNVDPFGGGWHQWKTSSEENEVIPYMQQPLEEEQVFVVGECWSDSQGWVQGALNTSEAMLQDMLGLDWPDWLQMGGTWLGPRK